MSDAVANGSPVHRRGPGARAGRLPRRDDLEDRFLESQGLIAPETHRLRVRKFYDADIDGSVDPRPAAGTTSLPLKVIKKMLDQGVDVADPSRVQPSLFASTEDEPDPTASAATRIARLGRPLRRAGAGLGQRRTAALGRAHPAVRSAPLRSGSSTRPTWWRRSRRIRARVVGARVRPRRVPTPMPRPIGSADGVDLQRPPRP